MPSGIEEKAHEREKSIPGFRPSNRVRQPLAPRADKGRGRMVDGYRRTHPISAWAQPARAFERRRGGVRRGRVHVRSVRHAPGGDTRARGSRATFPRRSATRVIGRSHALDGTKRIRDGRARLGGAAAVASSGSRWWGGARVGGRGLAEFSTDGRSARRAEGPEQAWWTSGGRGGASGEYARELLDDSEVQQGHGAWSDTGSGQQPRTATLTPGGRSRFTAAR